MLQILVPILIGSLTPYLVRVYIDKLDIEESQARKGAGRTVAIVIGVLTFITTTTISFDQVDSIKEFILFLVSSISIIYTLQETTYNVLYKQLWGKNDDDNSKGSPVDHDQEFLNVG